MAGKLNHARASRLPAIRAFTRHSHSKQGDSTHVAAFAASVQTMAEDRDSGQLVSAVDCYFMCQDGGMFKAKVVFAPYFYVQVKVGAGEAGSSPVLQGTAACVRRV
jgi:hypothetical protein